MPRAKHRVRLVERMTSVGFQFSPGVFAVKDADPEQTLERFEEYVEAIEMAFSLNRRVDPKTGAKVEFDDTDKKNILKLEGGHDMMDLFKHVGKVTDEDTYEAAVGKIRKALRGRGNRTAAVFKLFTGMPQGQKTFDSWHKKVYEAAKQVDWDGYNAETAAVDALVMQTKSSKLQQKAIQDNPSYEELIKLGISQEQARKKADALPDGGEESTRALEEVRKLKEELHRLGGRLHGGEEKKCTRCLLARCEGGERCPARTRNCNKCGELGHYSKSTLCKGKAKEKGVRKVHEEVLSDEEVLGVGRVEEETVAGVTRVGEQDSRIRVSLGMTRQGDSFGGVNIGVLADTGVRRTILNLEDWDKLGGGELKQTRLRFRPYGTNQQ